MCPFSPVRHPVCEPVGGVHNQVAVPALLARHPVHLGQMHDGQLVDVTRPAVLLLHADSPRVQQCLGGLAAATQKQVGLFASQVRYGKGFNLESELFERLKRGCLFQCRCSVSYVLLSLH